MRIKYTLPQFLLSLIMLQACEVRKSSQAPTEETKTVPGTFAFDVDFIKTYKNFHVLGTRSGKARVLIVGDYQGRVMTSSSDGDGGKSYGWINYDFIRASKPKPHMNPFGGEDRFWLGPEGGQYGIYFQKGNPFEFQYWQTPPLIDTESFELVSADSIQASFKKSGNVTNYQGTVFQLDVHRQIKLLANPDIEKEFGISLGNTRAVSFQSINTVTNSGPLSWGKKDGLLSIWILGMFNPSPSTVIVLPYKKSEGADGITDNYFGKIPDDRMVTLENVLLLKADGRHRGKVGIAPAVASTIAGSYDYEQHILTLVKYDLDGEGDYVNSKWEIQKEPFSGDVVNAYNDGPQKDGSQLGRFFELESSSPARELKPGESLTHRHTTLHLEGEEDELNQIALKTLGVGLDKIKGAFNR